MTVASAVNKASTAISRAVSVAGHTLRRNPLATRVLSSLSCRSMSDIMSSLRVYRSLIMLLLCGILLPAIVRAQLPAPPASSNAPIHLGGYGSAVVNAPWLDALDKSHLSQSSAAFLVSGTLKQHLAYFAEVDAVSTSRENYAGQTSD